MLGVGFDICESVQSESVRRFRTTHTEVLPALAGVRRTGGAEEERRVRSSFWGHILLEIFETGHVSHARRYSPRRMRNPRRRIGYLEGQVNRYLCCESLAHG